MKLRHLVLPALAVLPLFAHAGTDINYNQISLSSQVSQSVANDELNAILSKTSQATTATALAKTLNETTNKAQTIAKKYPKVKVTTGNQSTYPRYNNAGKIVGFTGSASINLQSSDFEQAGELLGELQTILTLDSLNFAVSDEAREKAEQEMMVQVAKKFQTDAKILSGAFGAKDYKIVNISFNSQNNDYGITVAPMMAMRDAAAEVAAPKELASGDSKLGYTASGTIELVK